MTVSDAQHRSKPGIVWPTSLMLLITPIVVVVAVPWYQLSVGFEWHHWLAFVVLAALNGISITAGYHRLWSHNAYQAHWLLRVFLALFGAAALQNSILVWSSLHRRHHRHVDSNEKDPYSANRGLWFSHIGWMLRHYPNNENDFSNCKDLQRDPVVVWQHRYYYTIALVMNFFPPLLLGVLTGDYLAYFIAAGFLRLVYSHHTTFFINSLAHYWGNRPYCSDNTARDNSILAFLTYGEGYHNYHHCFQNDYRNGIRWYHFDPTKWLIHGCSLVGLARDLRRTPKYRILEARITRQLEIAQDRLPTARGARDWYARFEAQIEEESQALKLTLAKWKDQRLAGISEVKTDFDNARRNLQQKFDESIAEFSEIDLEMALNEQLKRLYSLNAAMA